MKTDANQVSFEASIVVNLGRIVLAQVALGHAEEPPGQIRADRNVEQEDAKVPCQQMQAHNN